MSLRAPYGKLGFYTSDRGQTVKKFTSEKKLRKALAADNLQRIKWENIKKYYDLKGKKGTLKAGFIIGDVPEGSRKVLGIKDYQTIQGSGGFHYKAGNVVRGNDGRSRIRGGGYKETLRSFNIFTDPNYVPPKPAAPVKKAAPPKVPVNPYQTQINQLQANLNKTIADAQESTKSYQSLINNLKLGFGNQLAAAQTNYNTQTQRLIKKYGLEIGGLKTDFANQFAQQASAYDTKLAQQAADFKTRFEGQEASFAERLAKQQKGFDVSMANQSIAGRAPNLQIGSSQTGSPQQGGTAGFRRRPVQFNTPAYAGLSINSGNINL